MTQPLVTIGIPAFNRPPGLARTLASMCSQTYRNIEIIVSDNASTDPAVRTTVDEFAAKDLRISYHRHPENLGGMANFSSLIRKGSGDFFMWAADDDRWEPFFVERCVAGLQADPALAVCQMEAQYEVDGEELFPFFFEGVPFHDYSSVSPVERVKHLLRYGYGNLFYGVFRREALFHDGRPIIEWIGRTLNEIPMQILLASWGGISGYSGNRSLQGGSGDRLQAGKMGAGRWSVTKLARVAEPPQRLPIVPPISQHSHA
jgi:glycosyltransferase involved in cell wall biosynthesis